MAWVAVNRDVDEDIIEELSHYLNLSAEDLTGNGARNG